MKILALDVATNTGIAIGSPGSDPICWSESFGKGVSEDARFSKALVLVSRLIEEHKPDMIAVEAPVGGKDTSHFLVGLVACIRGCAHNRGVRLESYHASTVRKHFIGKAYTARDFPALSRAKAKMAIKQMVVDRCKLLGWSIPDHDAADAAALLDYALAVNTNHQARVAGGLF